MARVVYALAFGVYLGVKTCEVFLCFVAIVRVRAIVLTSLFSLFYVTGECHRFFTPRMSPHLIFGGILPL